MSLALEGSVTLSPSERSQLATLESTVEQGLASFVEVGNALAEIRDSKLYRETHATFAEYCRERWGVSGRHAARLMDAAEISVQIGPVGPQLTERTVRPLTVLPPEEQREAVEEVRVRVEGGEAPREAIAAVTKERTSPRQAPPPAPRPEDDSPADEAPDLARELENAGAEIHRLQGVVDSLNTTDQSREIVSLNARYASLNARLQQSLATGAEMRKTLDANSRLLASIRTELRVETNREILEAIRDLKR